MLKTSLFGAVACAVHEYINREPITGAIVVSMDGLELDIAAERYYEDIFKICENDGGKIDSLKATELFRSAQLSNDAIRQVSSPIDQQMVQYNLDIRSAEPDGQGRRY